MAKRFTSTKSGWLNVDEFIALAYLSTSKAFTSFSFYIALFILLAINLMLAFSNLIEQQKQNLQAQQKSFEQLNQQLHKTTMQIDQLRSAVKVGEVLTSIPNEQVKRVYNS